MDKLSTRERFSVYRKEDGDLIGWLRRLVYWLEELYGKQVRRINYNIGSSSSATWNPGSIADGSQESKDITVSGAQLGDFAIASFSKDVEDLSITAAVTAEDTVTVTLANSTGSAVDLDSGTVRVRVLSYG